jgi:hypothetical protein
MHRTAKRTSGSSRDGNAASRAGSEISTTASAIIAKEARVLTMPKIEKHLFYTSQWNDPSGRVLSNPPVVKDRGSANQLFGGLAILYSW